jgi:hypothetical protein
MGLCSEIVYLRGLNLLDDPYQASRIRHVTEVKEETDSFLMLVLIQVIDPIRIE